MVFKLATKGCKNSNLITTITFSNTNVPWGWRRVKQRLPPTPPTFLSLSWSIFFFFVFFFFCLNIFFNSTPLCSVMYGFFLQWPFQSAARDVINFIHTLWMFCLGKKRKRRKLRRREKSEEDGERKRRRRDGVAEGDFQCSCMYNEWGGTLFETPVRCFASRFAGQSGALRSHTSHSFYPANRCFHLAQRFDPVEKQI